MERIEAQKILGVDEDDGRDKIENRYENLIRRIRNGEELDGEKINAAYDFLTGRESLKEKQGKISAFYRNMMFHYKGWIVITVIVAAVVISLIVPMINKRVPDLTVSFAGQYGTRDLELFDEWLQLNMPETEDILVEVMYLDEEGESGEFDSGGRTRLTALLLTNEADILITDDSAFNYIRQDDALMILDEIVGKLDLEVKEENFVYGIDFSTGEKRIFGINVAGNKLVDAAIYGTGIRILCVSQTTMHPEAVEKAIEIILKDGRE